MVSMIAYDSYTKELDEIKWISKELISRLSEEQWFIEQFSSIAELSNFMKQKPLLDLLLYDVEEKEAVSYLQQIRRNYQKAHILLLADASTSPMEYIKPGICANSLLLRPWTKEQAVEILREFFLEYLKMIEQEKLEGSDLYIIESKEGTLSIPYDQIYYFEAREKKIYVSVGTKEFGFYNTIDKLAGELPEQFIRCHRGFIVNKNKIRKIMLSQNIIYLADGLDVPLSRSYKSVLKGFGK